MDSKLWSGVKKRTHTTLWSGRKQEDSKLWSGGKQEHIRLRGQEGSKWTAHGGQEKSRCKACTNQEECTVVRKEQKDESRKGQESSMLRSEEYTSLTGVVWKGAGVQRVLVRKGQIFLS